MPPKARVTREMIIAAGFETVRKHGIEHVNARTVSGQLGCSTQPVMYHFKRIRDMKKAIYEKADIYHTEYIMNIQGDNPMLEIGLSYIRFAREEKNLFRFLFQSDEFSEKSISELIHAEEIAPVIRALCEAAGVGISQAEMMFKALFLFVHGYASMFANNSLKYEEKVIRRDLEYAFTGMVRAAKEGTQ